MSDVVVQQTVGRVTVNLGANGAISGASTLTALNRLTKVTATGTIGMTSIAEPAAGNLTGVVSLRASSSAGLLLENSNGDDVLLLGAGPSQGITAYGQINGTSLLLSSLTSTRIPVAGTGGLLGDFAGLTLTSGRILKVGSGGSIGVVQIDGNSGNTRILAWLTGGLNRWQMTASSLAESGSNAGSNWSLAAYADDGTTLIDTPISITRASGGALAISRSTAIGATALLASERLRVAGGTMGTPGSTDVLIAAGAISCGSSITAAGVVTVPNGTAAAPGLRITSEQSGLYRASATSLGFAVAGVGVATLTNDRVFTVGNNVSYAVVAMDGAAGNVLAFRWQRNAQRRWDLVTTATAETGSNAGSDFAWSAYSDTGVFIDTPISIVRAAGGAIALARPISASGSILSVSATSGIGYGTGAGGTITQATSRTTGVTLNTVSGAITLFSTAGSTTPQSFTVTNSAVAATDTITLAQKSGTDKYVLLVTAVAAGSFQITAYTTGGTTSEAPVISFNVIKGVTA